ncbi:MAG: hypothetical protein SFY68_14395 [Candidatus Sumerlaeia bacterium]|nr:hypothetical protein [Candidatus Sumerlaeia bacterium]
MANTEFKGLLGDTPIFESDRRDNLDFARTAKVLPDVAVESANPLTIGIYVKWETGKKHTKLRSIFSAILREKMIDQILET